MTDLSEEEYNTLDEKWTKNTPKPGPNGTGFFAQKKAEKAANDNYITLDSFTADYLLTKAKATKKTPAEIVCEMVKKELSTV